MTDPNRTLICDTMTEMTTSVWLRLSMLVNLMITVVAFPILFYTLHYISAKRMFHPNTRIQIKVHIIAILIHCVGRFSLHLLDLINYFTNTGCDALPDFYRCFVVRGLYNFGLALAPMCSVALVAERSMALAKSSTYERCGTGFGIFLAFFQLALTFAFLFKLYINATFIPDSSVTLYYCQTLASGHGSVWTINAQLYVVMVGQIICRFVFWFLAVKTKKVQKERKLQTLSNRYTLQQSLRSIKALNMFINANCFVFFFFSFVTTTLHFNLSSMSRPTYFALVEVFHFIPTYGIVLSIYTYHSLRKLDEKSLTSFVNTVVHVDPSYYLTEFKKQIS